MSNRYSDQPRRQRIRAFVRDNPQCSTRMVADAFGIDSRHVGSELDQLKAWGFIEGVKVGRFMYWTCTDKAAAGEERGFVPRQPTVKTWAPHLVKCPLIWSLFGAPA